MKRLMPAAVLLLTLALAAGLDRLLLAQRQLAGRTGIAWPSVAVALLANVLLAACWLALAWLVILRQRQGRIGALVYTLVGLALIALVPLQWSGLITRALPGPWPALFPTWPPVPTTYFGQTSAVIFVIGLVGLASFVVQPRRKDA